MTWQLAINLISTGPTLASGMRMVRQDTARKVCRDCGVEMDVDNYAIAAWRQDGSPCYRPNCIPCWKKQVSAARKLSYRQQKERKSAMPCV